MRFGRLLCSLGLLMICAGVQADVSESFDYEVGVLTGMDGGSGWMSPWRNQSSRNGGNYVVGAPGLTHISLSGSESGNAAYTPGDGTRYQRTLDKVYDSGVVYLSFLMKGTSAVDDPYTALELQSGVDADPGRVFQIGILRKDDGIGNDNPVNRNEEFFATVRNGKGGGRLSSVKIAGFDSNTHRFVVRFDLDQDIAWIHFDPTAATDLSAGGTEIALFSGFSFDRIGLANFVGANATYIDEIVVDDTGIDCIAPSIGAQGIEPANMVFAWTAPVDPNLASITSYTIFVDPNELNVINANVAQLDYYNNAIAGDLTSITVPSGLAYNTDYFWRVSAQVVYDNNSTGVIDSKAWSFKTKMQDTPPVIDAGDNILTTVELASALTLNGVVDDDGTSPVSVLWEAYEVALDGGPTDKVVIANAASLNTTVSVSQAGVYVLKLTVTDANGPVTDQMEIRVFADSCQAAKLTGTWQANYYDRNSDCLVDINDFAVFAAEWLNSTSMQESATYTGTVTDPDTDNSLVAEVWTGIEGEMVDDLLSSPVYLEPAHFSYFVTDEFRCRVNGNNSGQRITGYIVPPANGNYTFYIASDDMSRLFVSGNTQPVDTDPALANHIASVPVWTNGDEWTKYPEQASVAIPMVAGNYYFVEVLCKQAVGGENLSVGWSVDGGTTITVIPGSALRHSLP